MSDDDFEDLEGWGDAEDGEGGLPAEYFVMTCTGDTPIAAVRRVSEWSRGPWMTGEPIAAAKVPAPFVFRVDPAYPGKLQAMYESGVPLMRDDLVEALQLAGVDNLQVFPAVIEDEPGGTRHVNYKAVNVIGVVDAADLSKSRMMDTSDSTLIDADFDALVLDERKAAGHLLFRLAESVSAIVVHESVRRQVEGAIPGMQFAASGEWSG